MLLVSRMDSVMVGGVMGFGLWGALLVFGLLLGFGWLLGEGGRSVGLLFRSSGHLFFISGIIVQFGAAVSLSDHRRPITLLNHISSSTEMSVTLVPC